MTETTTIVDRILEATDTAEVYADAELSSELAYRISQARRAVADWSDRLVLIGQYALERPGNVFQSSLIDDTVKIELRLRFWMRVVVASRPDGFSDGDRETITLDGHFEAAREEVRSLIRNYDAGTSTSATSNALDQLQREFRSSLVEAVDNDDVSFRSVLSL
jgi:hypothetical protein